MREIGIQPDVLVCRCDRPIARGLKEKIALFSNVPVERVVAAPDVGCIYELPLVLHAEGLDDVITERLNIWSRQPDLASWKATVEKFKKPRRGAVKIAVVGKYVHLKDSNTSLHEALVHGGLANDLCAGGSRKSTPRRSRRGSAANTMAGAHGAGAPAGSGTGHRGEDRGQPVGSRGAHPLLRICLGMQLAWWIRAARLRPGRANSTEFVP
jgi:CTP synthase